MLQLRKLEENKKARREMRFKKRWKSYKMMKDERKLDEKMRKKRGDNII